MFLMKVSLSHMSMLQASVASDGMTESAVVTTPNVGGPERLLVAEQASTREVLVIPFGERGLEAALVVLTERYVC